MSQVLVVDDEPSVRALLRRLLTAEFDAEVVEAGDGLQALEQLSRQNTSLVLLDISMPIMDGIETLEAIRQSPRLSSLPVAMMTAAREEPLVRRVIKLGVSDFLLKPLKRDVAIDRLSRLLGSAGSAIDGRSSRLLDLEPGADVLVVDASAEFRQFFRQQLGSTYRIREAQDGVEALRLCLTSAPQAIFIAPELEIFDAEMLARKLRLDSHFRSLALIAIVPQHANAGLPRRNIYDGVLTRSFVPEVFDESFRTLLAHGERPPLLSKGSPIIRQVTLAASQVCHMLLKTEVAPDEDGTIRDPAARRWCVAAVEVHTRDEAIDVRVLASLEATRALTGRRLDMDPRLLGEQDLLTTMGDIGSTLAETLSQTFARRGLQSGCGAARVECVTSVGLPASTSEHEHFQFALSGREDGSQIVIRLERLTACAAEGAS
jgi:CheY-like chemotaxis protein